MKRVCEGCRALGVRYYGGVHPSPYWHCKLGYPIRTFPGIARAMALQWGTLTTAHPGHEGQLWGRG